jgi:hypothetical protein
VEGGGFLWCRVGGVRVGVWGGGVLYAMGWRSVTVVFGWPWGVVRMFGGGFWVGCVWGGVGVCLGGFGGSGGFLAGLGCCFVWCLGVVVFVLVGVGVVCCCLCFVVW